MADPLLTTSSSLTCSHGATVNSSTSNTRVKVGGAYVVTQNDLFSVSGCPFQIPVGAVTKPQPCVKVQWVVPAKRVRINNQPILLMSSTGICQSAEQIPQGPPTVAQTQLRVRAS